jgi:hypothetical protein
VAKSARGFEFEARQYVVYWMPPLMQLTATGP